MNNENNTKLLFNKLSVKEEQIIKECLETCVKEFGDEEYTTLFGITREEMQEIADHWPRNKSFLKTEHAVNNVLVHLLYYPHGHHDDTIWNSYISASTEEVSAILHKLF